MKLRVQISTNDKTLTIPIISRTNPLGYDDNVSALVNSASDNSVNAGSDLEVRRFKRNNQFGELQGLTYRFFTGSTYATQLAPYDFAANGLTKISNEVRNSFYLMQVYDSFDENTQTKLHTGYFNGYDFTTKSANLDSTYTATTESTEFLDIYISNAFLETLSGVTTRLYAKFLFYSAQSSKFYPFGRMENLVNQEDVYTRIDINPTTFKYSFVDSVFVTEIVNPSYVELINNTVSSIPVQKTVYPAGNTFTSDGEYTTI